jgi:hypothetical protein
MVGILHGKTNPTGRIIGTSFCDEQLVLQATTLIRTSSSPAEQQARQHALSELVNSQDAWALIVPFLEHNDVNVQFYGAHVAGVKIVRDWLVFYSNRSGNLDMADLYF